MAILFSPCVKTIQAKKGINLISSIEQIESLNIVSKKLQIKCLNALKNSAKGIEIQVYKKDLKNRFNSSSVFIQPVYE